MTLDQIKMVLGDLYLQKVQSDSQAIQFKRELDKLKEAQKAEDNGKDASTD